MYVCGCALEYDASILSLTTNGPERSQLFRHADTASIAAPKQMLCGNSSSSSSASGGSVAFEMRQPSHHEPDPDN